MAVFSSDVAIAILCGGKSRRFGSDKLAALLHGKPILQHTIDVALACGAPLALVGKEFPTFLSGSACPFVPDRLGDSPLAGLHAALHWSPCEQVIVIAGDMPLVTVQMLSVLSTWLAQTPVIGAERGGRLHPLFARYERCLAREAERLWSLGERSAKSLAETMGYSLVPHAVLGEQRAAQLALDGVNTTEVLAILDEYMRSNGG
jgi:molybdopterin-guanine dinucleotide biosynthesis protein A